MSQANAIRDRNSSINKTIVRCRLPLKQFDHSPTLTAEQVNFIKHITSDSRHVFDIRAESARPLTERYLKFLNKVYSDKRGSEAGFAVPVGCSTYHVQLKPAALTAMINMIKAGIAAAEAIWPTNGRTGAMSNDDKDDLIRKYLILDDNMLVSVLRDLGPQNAETQKKTRRIAGILSQRGYEKKYPKTISEFKSENDLEANNLININHIDYMSMLSYLRNQATEEQIKHAATYILFMITNSTRQAARQFKPAYDAICSLFNSVEKVPNQTDARFIPATTMTPKKIERLIFMAASTLMPELRVSSLDMLPLAKNLPESVHALQNASKNMTDDNQDIFKVASIARALINPFDCVYNFGVNGILNTIANAPGRGSKGFVYKSASSETTFLNADLELNKDNREASIDVSTRYIE